MKKILQILLIMLLPNIIMAGERIVTIGGGVGEIVVALGKKDNVIATDLTSRYIDGFDKIKNIGYIRRINAESIISANPTMILAEDGTGPENQLKLLKSAFKETHTIPVANNMEEVYNRIKIIGKILKVPNKSDELITKMKKQYATTQSKLNKVNKKVRIMAIMVSSYGVFAAGDNSSFGRVIKMAKGNNVFSTVNNYTMITNEAIINMNPDVVLYFSHGREKAKRQDILNHPAIKTTNAVKNGRVYSVDSYLMISYGPRTVDAIEDIAKKIHPAIFK